MRELPNCSCFLVFKEILKSYSEPHYWIYNALPAFPEKILKIAIFHELYQNKDGLRYGHHSHELHHMFCSEEEENKQRTNDFSLPAPFHGGRFSEKLTPLLESSIIVQELHSTLSDRIFLIGGQCLGQHIFITSSRYTCLESLRVPL